MPAPPDVRAFHRSLPGYEPTPLHDLGDGVFLKDESGRFGLPAFKVLGASWAVEQVLAQRPDVRTLVAASAGNHGRAVAWMARRRGLQARIFLPAAAAPRRVAAIEGEGAEVIRAAGDYEVAITEAEAAAQADGAALIADHSHTPGDQIPTWIAEGYSTLFREAGAFDVILAPMGVGALASAAVLWAPTIGVEPQTAACVTASLQAGAIVTIPTPGTAMAGMDCSVPSAVAWPALKAGLQATVTVSDAEVAAAQRELGARGIVVGECGASAYAALPQARELTEGRRVLLVATEGPTG